MSLGARLNPTTSTTHTYHLFDRRTKTVNALGHSVETVWCKRGHVTESKSCEQGRATDLLKVHHKTTYDNVSKSDGPESLSLRTVARRERQRAKMTDQKGHTVGWAFDELDRMKARGVTPAGRADEP